MTILLPKDSQGRWELRIDPSLLTGTNCPLRTHYTLVEGLDENTSKEAADYGTAAHKVLAAWYGGATLKIPGAVDGDGKPVVLEIHAEPYDLKVALPLGQDWFRTNIQPSANSWRTLSHFTAMMNGYFNEYKDNDGLVADAVEERFEYLWYQDDKVVVYLCGTKDFKGRHHGEKVVADHKSHTPFGYKKRDELIDDYLYTYKNSVQGMTYVLHEYLTTGEIPGFMVNGLFLEKGGKNNFKRSEVFKWTISELMEHKSWVNLRIFSILNDFKATLKLQELGQYNPPPRNRLCCHGEKFDCKFLPLCNAPDAEHRELLKKLNYKAQIRDPRTFGGG